jgi:hypothetical protein
MGAWGVLAFDNDSANDWAHELEHADDLTLVESALDEVLSSEGDFVESDAACNALAACEVLARLRGHPGYTNSYTETVDKWVAAHRKQIVPTEDVLVRASVAIDRVVGEGSELRELWEEADGDEWRDAVEDLRRRLRA